MPEGGLDRSPVGLLEDETATDLPYNVLLWNDPVTPMQVVTRVLQKVFEITKDAAELLMITAHHEDKVVVWCGEREKAERYCIALGNSGLMASVGKS